MNKFDIGDKVKSIKHPEFGTGTVISVTYRSGVGPVRVEWNKTDRKTAYTQRGTQMNSNEVRIVKLTKLELAISE